MPDNINSFDPEYVRHAVEKLDKSRRLAFLLSLAERFYPAYASFSRMREWGSPTVLAHAIDEAWDVLEGNQAIQMIKSTEKAVLDVTPDTEMFEGADVPLALAACAIVVYLIRFVRTQDPSSLVQAAQSAADAVDSYAGWLLFGGYSGEDTREMWDQQKSHPVVQRELQSMEEDLDFLQQLPSLDGYGLRLIQKRFRAEPKWDPSNT